MKTAYKLPSALNKLMAKSKQDSLSFPSFFLRNCSSAPCCSLSAGRDSKTPQSLSPFDSRVEQQQQQKEIFWWIFHVLIYLLKANFSSTLTFLVVVVLCLVLLLMIRDCFCCLRNFQPNKMKEISDVDVFFVERNWVKFKKMMLFPTILKFRKFQKISLLLFLSYALCVVFLRRWKMRVEKLFQK